MIKAGIFDFYGVLAPEYFVPMHEDIIKELGISMEGFQNAWKLLYPDFGVGKITEQEFWEKLKEITNFKNPLPAKSLFLRKYSETFKKIEGMTEVLKKLKTGGIKLAILSNVIKPHADYNRQIGAYEDFDVVVLSNEVGVKKPDLKFFQLALNLLKIRPNEAFFVDDKLKYVEIAETMGMHGIEFTTVENFKKDLEKINIHV